MESMGGVQILVLDTYFVRSGEVGWGGEWKRHWAYLLFVQFVSTCPEYLITEARTGQEGLKKVVIKCKQRHACVCIAIWVGEMRDIVQISICTAQGIFYLSIYFKDWWSVLDLSFFSLSLFFFLGQIHY